MAAKNLITTLAKQVGRTSGARCGAPTLGAQGLLSAPRGGPPFLAPGLVRSQWGSRFMSTGGKKDKFPGWMYGGMGETPEEAFGRLKPEDKELLYLIQVMLNEVKRTNADGVTDMLVELNRISATQKADGTFMNLVVVGFSGGAYIVYSTAQEAKSKTLEVSENLAANSGEIVSDLIEAAKHGIAWPRIFGEGKKWEFKPRWLEPPAAQEAEAQKEKGAAHKK